MTHELIDIKIVLGDDIQLYSEEAVAIIHRSCFLSLGCVPIVLQQACHCSASFLIFEIRESVRSCFFILILNRRSGPFCPFAPLLPPRRDRWAVLAPPSTNVLQGQEEPQTSGDSSPFFLAFDLFRWYKDGWQRSYQPVFSMRP